MDEFQQDKLDLAEAARSWKALSLHMKLLFGFIAGAYLFGLLAALVSG